MYASTVHVPPLKYVVHVIMTVERYILIIQELVPVTCCWYDITNGLFLWVLLSNNTLYLTQKS